MGVIFISWSSKHKKSDFLWESALNVNERKCHMILKTVEALLYFCCVSLFFFIYGFPFIYIRGSYMVFLMMDFKVLNIYKGTIIVRLPGWTGAHFVGLLKTVSKLQAMHLIDLNWKETAWKAFPKLWHSCRYYYPDYPDIPKVLHAAPEALQDAALHARQLSLPVTWSISRWHRDAVEHFHAELPLPAVLCLKFSQRLSIYLIGKCPRIYFFLYLCPVQVVFYWNSLSSFVRVFFRHLTWTKPFSCLFFLSLLWLWVCCFLRSSLCHNQKTINILEICMDIDIYARGSLL